jgi:hypothetical protein
MRKQMKKFLNKRGPVLAYADFERYSVVKKLNKRRDFITVTMLLKNIELKKGNQKIKIGHSWIKLNEQFYDLNIKEGSKIDFHCKVGRYNKFLNKWKTIEKYTVKNINTIHILEKGNGPTLYDFLTKLGIDDHNCLLFNEEI